MKPLPTRIAVFMLALALPVPVRGDAVDNSLFAALPKIRAALEQRGTKNVGILKFEVQLGGVDGPIGMSVGNLNTMMASRIENLVILTLVERDRIGIVRGPSALAARRDLNAGYHSEAGRRALLTRTYPLAWGARNGAVEVAIDTFITGRIILSEEFKTATVVLCAFDGRDIDPKEIARVESPMEIALLVDAGLPFATSIAEIARRYRSSERAEPIALDEARKSAWSIFEASRPRETVNRISLRPLRLPLDRVKNDLDRVLKFEAIYDGEVLKWTVGDSLPIPRQRQSFSLRLRATEPLGVVLRANGVNTADSDRGEKPVHKYKKWILEPNKEYTIRGIHRGDGEVTKFTARKCEEVDLSELGNERRIGEIEFYVFQAPAMKEGDRDLLGNDAFRASRSVNLRFNLQPWPGNREDLRAKLRSITSESLVHCQLILPARNDEFGFPAYALTFDGIQTMHVPIRYSDPRLASPTFLPVQKQ